MNICPVCGGNLEPMGYLGKIFWRRCKNCGTTGMTMTPTMTLERIMILIPHRIPPMRMIFIHIGAGPQGDKLYPDCLVIFCHSQNRKNVILTFPCYLL
jgi:hypothetical protein